LPAVRQYREFVAWEQSRITGAGSSSAIGYWREKLRDARIFALPADRPVREVHTRPYSGYHFTVDVTVMAAISAFAREIRGSVFMVLLAAFNVLAHQITGTTDPVIQAFSNGRNDPVTYDVVGSIMNILALRTDIGGCVTFREIVECSRETSLKAYSHEMPIKHIERELPKLMQPLKDPRMCFFVIGVTQSQFDDSEFQIGDSSYQVRERVVQEPESNEIPQGCAWTLDMLPSGQLAGHVQYNLDEFDERTVMDWIASYQRILCGAAADPDRAWKTL
jgi:non-ribosomal peptide synthetase component F